MERGYWELSKLASVVSLRQFLDNGTNHPICISIPWIIDYSPEISASNMDAYKQSTLWKTAFPDNATDHIEQRQRIVQAYERFRERVAHLLQQIQKELPNLTLHDITHVDALWEVTSQIAGPNYPLNPAEALVLGGAFLLHDAAHCRAAYPGGLDEIRKLSEWRDAAVRRNLNPDTLNPGSNDFQAVLFDTLRVLHPRQAKTLAFAKWKDVDGDEFLFPDSELRNAYGDLIGEIAESHWFHPHQLENFGNSPKTAPVCLAPANWTVNPLKLAVLLRVADACHLDAKRAPRFLMLLNQPTGVSAVHWQFQSKINQVSCDTGREELLITGSPFAPEEQAAWWQAYDAACLADRELSAADGLLRDFRIQRLAAREVAGVRNPESFARHVPPKGWHPVDTSLRISNIQSVVERFGGEKLYGDKPWLALRELIQNARDAIHAARSLNYLDQDEGEIEVAVEDVDGGHWLHVTDNGIGMSRYVLTEVLLDFGHSLWRSADLSGEWSGLASSGFEAVGQFGIGFFSVFMLGDKVRVCTRRCEAKEDENDRGWVLQFDSGPRSRPILREPLTHECRKRPGTRISVLITQEKLQELCIKENTTKDRSGQWTLEQTCAFLAPALDINLFVHTPLQKIQAVQANDWKTLPPLNLLQRIAPIYYKDRSVDDFGHWQHISGLYDDTGALRGRCSVSTSYINNLGIGVTNGIFAGYLNGLCGLVFSQSQKDLARQYCTPAITLANLQNWAEKKKKTLFNLNALDDSHSALLIQLGASYENLIIGSLGGERVSFQELLHFLGDTKTLLIHEGDVRHDGDDGVRESSFTEFRAAKQLFETNDLERHISWLEEVEPAAIDHSTWCMTAAVEAALSIRHFLWENTKEYVPVGTVEGTTIYRLCRAVDFACRDFDIPF